MTPVSPPRANHPGTILRAVARGFFFNGESCELPAHPLISTAPRTVTQSFATHQRADRTIKRGYGVSATYPLTPLNGENGCRITRCEFPVRLDAAFAH